MATDEVMPPYPTPDPVQEYLAKQPPPPPVDPALVEAVIAHESSGNSKAKGSKGELGLMQISPALAKDFGAKEEDLLDPSKNRAIGERFLGHLMQKYDGDMEKVLMAYNGGPENVDKGKVSKQAQSYAQSVLETFGNLTSHLTGEGTAQAGEPGGPPPWLKQAGVKLSVPKEWQQPQEAQGAPQGESLGQHISRAYKENIAQPLTGMVQGGLEAAGRQFPNAAAMSPVTGKEAAEFLIPQTPTQAAIAGAGLLLPQVRAGEAIAEGAGPVAKFLGSRLGNIAGTGAIGAGVAAATGDESPAAGAAEGVGAATIGNVLRGGAGMLGRTMGAKSIASDYSESLASKVSEMAPTAGKFKTATQLFDSFREGGQALDNASKELAFVKGKVSQSLPPTQRFDMPILEGVGQDGKPQIRVKKMTFNEADNLLTDYGKRAYSMSTGEMRNTYMADHINDVAYEAKKDLIRQLNQAKPGLGDMYRTGRKNFATTSVLQDMLNEKGVFDPATGQLSQPKLSELMQKGGYYKKLQRALDDPTLANEFKRAVGRGYEGAAQDIAAQPMQIGRPSVGIGGLHPRVHPHLGSTVQPVGDLPFYAKPPEGPATYLGENILRQFMGQGTQQ